MLTVSITGGGHLFNALQIVFSYPFSPISPLLKFEVKKTLSEPNPASIRIWHKVYIVCENRS